MVFSDSYYVTPHMKIYVFLLIKCILLFKACNIIRHSKKIDNSKM